MKNKDRTEPQGLHKRLQRQLQRPAGTNLEHLPGRASRVGVHATSGLGFGWVEKHGEAEAGVGQPSQSPGSPLVPILPRHSHHAPQPRPRLRPPPQYPMPSQLQPTSITPFHSARELQHASSAPHNALAPSNATHIRTHTHTRTHAGTHLVQNDHLGVANEGDAHTQFTLHTTTEGRRQGVGLRADKRHMTGVGGWGWLAGSTRHTNHWW